MGWLLVLGLKECLVECATLCIKSEVMLMNMNLHTLCIISLDKKVVCTNTLKGELGYGFFPMSGEATNGEK